MGIHTWRVDTVGIQTERHRGISAVKNTHTDTPVSNNHV